MNPGPPDIVRQFIMLCKHLLLIDSFFHKIPRVMFLLDFLVLVSLRSLLLKVNLSLLQYSDAWQEKRLLCAQNCTMTSGYVRVTSWYVTSCCVTSRHVIVYFQLPILSALLDLFFLWSSFTTLNLTVIAVSEQVPNRYCVPNRDTPVWIPWRHFPSGPMSEEKSGAICFQNRILHQFNIVKIYIL